jgi:hypothetical protein
MQLPSASNTAGTVLGTIAGAAVVAAAPSWPFIIAMAAATGMTPIGIAGVLGVIATASVNYAATHYAEIKNLNGVVATWWPQIQQSYPGDPKPPLSTSNIDR